MRAHEFITELGFSGKKKFKGSACKQNCNGHAAGYMWAAQKKLKNPKQCPNTPSSSFNNGCRIKGKEEMPILTKLWNLLRGRED